MDERKAFNKIEVIYAVDRSSRTFYLICHFALHIFMSNRRIMFCMFLSENSKFRNYYSYHNFQLAMANDKEVFILSMEFQKPIDCG